MKIKTILITILFINCGINIQAQVRIGEDAKPVQGAVLDVNSTTNNGYYGGLLLPNTHIVHVRYIPEQFTERSGTFGDTGEATDLEGMIVYNTNAELKDENDKILGTGIFLWDGYKWHAIGLAKETSSTGENELPSGPDGKDEYEPDIEGNIFIKGTSCLSIQQGYNPNSPGADANIYDKKDNLYLEGNNSPSGYNNLTQSYTVVGETENLSSLYWALLPKDYGNRSIAEHIEEIIFSNPLDGTTRTSNEDDGTFLTCTIIYKENAGKVLEAAIDDQCPNENGLCFVRLEIEVYYTYSKNGIDKQLVTDRTCYFQNYTCCEGYICEGCAYDYVNGTPGNWAEVGVGDENSYSHPNISLYISGTFHGSGSIWDPSYIPTLEAGFKSQSAGDLCVYKSYSNQPSSWLNAIKECQDATLTDGKKDFGWYLPNLMELYQIYISLGGNGSQITWPSTGLGTSEDFDGGEIMTGALHLTSTEFLDDNKKFDISLGFNFYDGSIGNFTKKASVSNYKVRCVRRMN